ncbi:hypothetical protein KPL71_008100 [Citrus sinensis]|uniref:Uncharacterized protein n=1 Tax=Citrus sinensis TaxID=2711 RepID=A0ACB8M4E3_CITSI|nr:hypothetical protein KPL71_008100 [Citrus sinensis]
MEVYGKSMVAGPTNVVYLSTILGRDGPIPVHKCDRKCDNEHVCGNMYICKLTGFTHICDKNCNQRILYDNHNSLCRVSGQIFPLTQAEEQAVRGVRRKLDADNSPSDACAFKRRRDAQCHPSPFERSFSAFLSNPTAHIKNYNDYRILSGRRPATNLIELVQGLIAIYAFDDGTSTFTCKAYDYAFMLLYSALTLAAAGMLKGSNGSLSPSIQDPSSTKAQQMVSSSNNLHLQPLKLSIFIFLVLV